MRQQLECEVARGRGTRRGCGQAWPGPGGACLCVCVCVNVRGKSPVSLGPEETGAIHTVCYSFDRQIGVGVGGVLGGVVEEDAGGLFVVES